MKTKAADAEPGQELRLILGLQAVREAIRVHGTQITEVLVATGAGLIPDKLARFATDQGVAKVRQVARAELDQLARGVAHQDVAAWAPPLEFVDLTALFEVECFLGIALDGIQDPQNFGAVIRSAVGLARASVVWPEHASAPLTPATFRASAGAIEHARLCRVRSLRHALDAARDCGVQVVGLDAQASQTLSDTDLTRPTLLVLGNEHKGMSGPVRARCDFAVRLAETWGVESLNASVAAGISLYEATKQRSTANS